MGCRCWSLVRCIRFGRDSSGVVHDAWGPQPFSSLTRRLLHPGSAGGSVGEDFPKSIARCSRGVNRYVGPDRQAAGRPSALAKYTGDMNTAETLEVHLNVLGVQPRPFRRLRRPYVFLAGSGPTCTGRSLHERLAEACRCRHDEFLDRNPARRELYALLREVDGLVLNDGEARCSRRSQPRRAGQSARPRAQVRDHQEGGTALFLSESESFVMPRLPLGTSSTRPAQVTASRGGFMGSLAASGKTGPASSRPRWPTARSWQTSTSRLQPSALSALSEDEIDAASSLPLDDELLETISKRLRKGTVPFARRLRKVGQSRPSLR